MRMVVVFPAPGTEEYVRLARLDLNIQVGDAAVDPYTFPGPEVSMALVIAGSLEDRASSHWRSGRRQVYCARGHGTCRTWIFLGGSRPNHREARAAGSNSPGRPHARSVHRSPNRGLRYRTGAKDPHLGVTQIHHGRRGADGRQGIGEQAVEVLHERGVLGEEELLAP